MVFAAVQGLQFFVLVQYKQLRYEWPHIFTDVFGVYVLLLGGNVYVLYYVRTVCRDLHKYVLY